MYKQKEEFSVEFKHMTEADAKDYLHKNNNYFKLTSYRKNYTKYTTGAYLGMYEHLDFAYLVELARIDVSLRQVILAMCLDIEHFLKVQLISAIEQASNEDGYSIIQEYIFDTITPSRLSTMNCCVSQFQSIFATQLVVIRSASVPNTFAMTTWPGSTGAGSTIFCS